LIVSHEFPPHIFGGIGVFCHDLANALSEKGMHVTVVAGCPSRIIKGKSVERRIASSNLEILRVPRIDLAPSHLWYQLMNLSSLSHLISEFDVIHGQDCSAFPLISLCKRSNPKVPWVVTVHTDPASELRYALRSVFLHEGSFRDFLTYVVGFPLWDLSLRTHAKLADALVTVSQASANEVASRYEISPRTLHTINTGVNMAHLESIARRRSIRSSASDRIKLFYGGRLYWRKGITYLLKSLAHLTHRIGFKEFELEVFGRGPLEARVRELVSSLKLSRNVEIRGFVEYEELIASMARSDVVCIPSLYEACPIGMIEAMALGRPTMAFSRAFSRELLNDVPGLSLAESIVDYARCLYRLCSSEDLRKKIGVALQNRVRERFDIRRVADSYLKLYRDVSS
jgi:1,4-alpha-glucan branching enzyme